MLLPTVYEDAGISGGTLERPGLQRLLADIDAGLVDQIVVYKVDRLTRSPSCAKTRPSRHRRKNCASRNQAQTLARERVTRQAPTFDCGSTNPQALALFTVGDVYASLCKRGAYAPFSAQRRSRTLFRL